MPLYDPFFYDPGPPKSVKATGLSPTFAFPTGSASVSPAIFPPGAGPAGAHKVRVEPVSFDDLVLRIRALTGLSPRRASLIAGEFECATRVIDPSDMELVVKAKEYGYLPDEWRLP